MFETAVDRRDRSRRASPSCFRKAANRCQAQVPDQQPGTTVLASNLSMGWQEEQGARKPRWSCWGDNQADAMSPRTLVFSRLCCQFLLHGSAVAVKDALKVTSLLQLQ